jgi:bifunctional N-acetylglucosamine-1-phosphate-uridyltransferase/glucosamine-1-phosphate-acetyltransferase GlmU-like protein
MVFDAGVLPSLLSRIGNGNSQGEYYLDRQPWRSASASGFRVGAAASPDWLEVRGVNDPMHLGGMHQGV